MKIWKIVVAAFCGMMVLSCDSNENDNGKGDPRLINIEPQNAKPGDTLILTGENFVPGMQLCFGTGMDLCTDVTVKDTASATVVLPQVNGTDVEIRFVLADGTSIGQGGISFASDDEGRLSFKSGLIHPIEWCRLQGPGELTIKVNTTSPEIYGTVYSKNCTGENGTCEKGLPIRGSNPNDANAPLIGYDPNDISGEICVQPIDIDTNDKDKWQWKCWKALYNKSEGNNDEYAGKILYYGSGYEAGQINEPGTYRLAYRFSQNDGFNWPTYCDYDDEAGFDIHNTGIVTVLPNEDDGRLYWGHNFSCGIYNAPNWKTISRNESLDMYLQVYMKGCTDGDEKCEKIKDVQCDFYPASTNSNGKLAFNHVEYAPMLTYNAEYKENNDEYVLSMQFSEGDRDKWVYDCHLTACGMGQYADECRKYHCNADWSQILQPWDGVNLKQ